MTYNHLIVIGFSLEVFSITLSFFFIFFLKEKNVIIYDGLSLALVKVMLVTVMMEDNNVYNFDGILVAIWYNYFRFTKKFLKKKTCWRTG